VRVKASDGFHNASDASDGAFRVPDKAPLVHIYLPEDGDTVSAPLNLLGYVYDLEDGAMEGTALAWTSDRDGSLGAGDTVWDVDLSPGVHVLTLTATDSQTQVGNESITITVVEGGAIYLPLMLRAVP
jgi:hypothetical protein